MKKTIALTVNGQAVTGEVEPRLQLADFLREHLYLTGTHLGCEHGVCGACTVEIDGAPARSCIAYAVACDGSQVRTIEGYDDDPVMTQLREAFSAEHALQCGYCTPGMLVTARDIVTRLPDADEARIRRELSGNLCRCTGYVGIVRAIQSVLRARGGTSAQTISRAQQRVLPSAARERDTRDRSIQPARPGAARSTPMPDTALPATPQRTQPRTPQATTAERAADAAKPQTTLHESFTIAYPREQVWAFFGRLDQIALCLPGTSLLGMRTDNHVDTKMRVKVGPIVAEFQGSADAVRDDVRYSGVIQGSARDTRSPSTTRGEIRYALHEAQANSTRVEVDVGFTLTGPLAQFGRSSLVQDIASRMTAAFVQNLQARLSGAGDRAQTTSAAAPELDAGSLVFSALWNRVRRFFRALIGR
jgi:carbon-monoxide dehydrogenase small subunit